MNNTSKKTLQRIENDDGPWELSIGNEDNDFGGSGVSGEDFSKLGTAISNNTRIAKLVIDVENTVVLDVSNQEFYGGLKQNSSIYDLTLFYNGGNLGEVGCEILKAYEGSSNLTNFHIAKTNLQNGGATFLADTLRSCRNLTSISAYSCNINDGQLLLLVDAIKEGHLLEDFWLYGNRIGNSGCEALAELLKHPNSNLLHLELYSNEVDNEGVSFLSNSLANNKKLKVLNICNNPFDAAKPYLGNFGILTSAMSVSWYKTTYVNLGQVPLSPNKSREGLI